MSKSKVILGTIISVTVAIWAFVVLSVVLKSKQAKDEVKVFELVAGVSQWEVRKGSVIEIWGFNKQLPGPTIRVKEGERVRITVKNQLPEPTAVHWHSLDVPNKMDGVPHVTQDPIMPNSEFVYEFTVKNKPGTYMYHSHANTIEQIPKGMYGLFIVEPKNPEKKYDGEFLMMLSETQDGHYLVGGKSFPATDVWNVKPGGTYIIRVANISQANYHPMHIHGHTLTVIAEDGRPLRIPRDLTTIDVPPGKTYDLELIADAKEENGEEEKGVWLFHCHILAHVNGPDPSSHDIAQAHTGMVIVIKYQ